MTDIPIIDVSPALEGRGLGPTAAAIDAACREVGFFQIVGHGVPNKIFDDVYQAAPDLWGRPLAEKEATLLHADRHPFYGWYTRDDANGSPLQEKWEMNNFDSPADARERGVPEQYLDRFSTNLWPTQLPHFVDAVTACFAAGRALGDRVMGLFAVALGLDEDFFAAGCVNDSSYFAVNNYPGLSTEPSGDVALFEHSDSGTLTLLHQRGNYEGLQVGLRSGERFSVPVIDDAVIVNIGDLMARWTNDRWLATRHRVLLGETGQHRTSITTFHTPSLDTIVSPLPTCIDAGTPYEPISVYDWEPVFLAKTYQ